MLRIAVSSCERSYYTQGRAPWPSAESNIQRVSSSALVSTGFPQWEGAVQRRTSQLSERRCVLALRFSWPSADALEFSHLRASQHVYKSYERLSCTLVDRPSVARPSSPGD